VTYLFAFAIILTCYKLFLLLFRFFNYSKSPKRGVRDISIEIDGNIVFMGTLRAADR
jgi:hypothetical protein